MAASKSIDTIIISQPISENFESDSAIIEQKWSKFYDEFIAAVNAKDKDKISRLAAQDFFDGSGGETINEWLDSIVFNDKNNYIEFKKMLNGKIKNVALKEGENEKATGNGNYGDLYFEYEKGQWKFGGIIGD